jgi:hypothetical protein
VAQLCAQLAPHHLGFGHLGVDHVRQLPFLVGAHQQAAGGLTLDRLEEVSAATHTQTIPRESLRSDLIFIEIDDELAVQLLAHQRA